VRDDLLMAGGFEARTEAGGPAVLPDDGVMDRLAGLATPQESCLALIGDADRGDVARCDAGFGDGAFHGFDGGAPEILRIMIDPARGGEMLPEFLLRRAGDRETAIKDDRSRRRRALINGEEISGHPTLHPPEYREGPQE